jgi:amino acid adenylation domain-containing protein
MNANVNLQELLSEIAGRGLRLRLDGDRIVLRGPRGRLTPELRDVVAARRSELVALLVGGKDNPEYGRDATPTLKPAPRDRPLPLSFAEERLWFLDQLEGPSHTYNLPSPIRLVGRLDLPALEYSIDRVLERHEILRTTYRAAEEAVLRIVHPHRSVDVNVTEFAVWHVGRTDPGPGPDLDQSIREWIRNEAKIPFDLETGPLLRVHALRIAPDDHVLLLNLHHIVCDGWSMSVLIDEFSRFYDARVRGLEAQAPPLPIQYADFAWWQRRVLGGTAVDRGLAYWRGELQGAPPLIELPLDRPRPMIQTYIGTSENLVVPPEIARSLSEFARRSGTTLFVVLLAAFKVLLARYGHQNDIVVGSTFANRSRIELENLIGFFVNTLALRTRFTPGLSFAELVARVHRKLIEAHEYSDIPFERIVEALQPERNLSHSPLVQVIFDFHSAPRTLRQLPGLRIEPVRAEGVAARFDLVFDMHETLDGLAGRVEYNTHLFEPATIHRLILHFVNLLAAAVRDPHTRVDCMRMITDEERRRALVTWNDTARDYPRGRSVHQLFSEQARRTPDAVAATCGNARVSYRTLEIMSNRIAHALLARGVGVEDQVALFFNRGIECLIAMLAVLKADAAFVPLDPRLAFPLNVAVLSESGATLTLVAAAHRTTLAGVLPADAILCIDDVLAGVSGHHPPTDRSRPNSLAYVIYTSGSTGAPKGVMIEHEGMLNHILAHVADQEITGADVIAQTAVQTFDIFVWQSLCALMVGGTTAIIAGEAAWEPAQLVAQLEREDVTIVQTVPSHTEFVLAEIESSLVPRLGSLRWFISHAETLTTDQCRRWLRAVPGSRMINGYGATEVSDDTSQLHIVEAPGSESANMPIGGILANLAHYVLDDGGDPVPVGVPGEVYVGGIGVGRGYLRNPRLTAAVFLPDPYGSAPSRRRYRIGDLAKYCQDGTFELLGRLDFQVRIRGFRIESAEVEWAIGRHPQVGQCAVVARTDTHSLKHLVAYVIPKRYPAPIPAEIEAFLKDLLPQYMIPSYFVFLDAFPVGRTGKMSRNLLPDPPFAGEHERTYVAPRDAREAEMAALWAEVLHCEQISVRDSFFSLGGHSLLAARLVARMRKMLGRDVPLRCLFEAPTIEGFLEAIGSASGTADGGAAQPAALKRVNAFDRTDAVPLAPAQIAVWYAWALAPDSIVYNVNYGGLFLVGDLHIDDFIAAWQTFVDRHDAFRIRFGLREGRPVQYLGEAIRLTPDDILLDLRGRAHAEREALIERLEREHANTLFDLARGPLLRLTVVDYGEGQYQVMFVTHHIIWDEQSLMNLYAEISELYNARREKRRPHLPELRLTYLDYARWMNDCLDAGEFEMHRRYWLAQYQDLPPALDLPTDFPRPPIITYNGDWVFSWLPRETARSLDAFLARRNVSLFMFMLAVIDLWLYRFTGQDDIVIGCPIAGRPHEDFEPLIGLFATPMPIRARMFPDMLFTDLLAQVARRSVEAFEHYTYPASKLIEELQLAKDLSRPRLFSIMYGVQNDKTEAIGRLELVGVRPDRTRGTGDDGIARLGARFDLNFIIDRWSSDVCVNCIYNTDLYRKETVTRLVKSISELIDTVLAEPEWALCDYRLGGASLQFDPSFNRTTVAYDAEATIFDLFARQAARDPSQPALEEADGPVVTYGALLRMVYGFARRIEAAGVVRNDRVILMLTPSVEMIVSMLAVLATGACYVPIALDTPPERISRIVERTGARHSVAGARLEVLAALGLRVIAIEDAASAQEADLVWTPPCGDPNSLAYIIYTSGSTGVPKAIPIRHRGIVSMFAATTALHRITTADRVLFTMPYTFDASVMDIFWPLTSGATVVIPDSCGPYPPAALGGMLVSLSITWVQCVPIVLEALAEARLAGAFEMPRALRGLVCGGDTLSRRTRDLARAAFPVPLFNHYGPTEVTVDATAFDCSLDFDGEITPIGRPLANVEVFILDDRQAPVPPMVVGEIYVASQGLAEGYLGEDELTQASFVELNPGDGIVRRLYRTGDLGSFALDGTIAFRGRRDRQVKVRGYRVDLEEVTQTLLQHDAVAAACVSHVRQNDSVDDALAAYIELKARINRFEIGNRPYRLFTLAQRPDLGNTMRAVYSDGWPAYFAGETAMRPLWQRIFSEAPTLQLALVAEDGRFAAAANAVSLRWNGRIETLPAGWTEGLRLALDQSTESGTPNTLMLLAVAVAYEFRGRGLSLGMLEVSKVAAAGLGFERILVAVRPSDKAQHPEVSFADWCELRRGDSQLVDSWLRTHERAGGRMLAICPRSQRIEGTCSDWERWTGWRAEKSGTAAIPYTLQPAEIDIERDSIAYYDPAAWFEHTPSPGGRTRWHHVDKDELRAFFAARLPHYMVPDRYRFVERMPLTGNGTIDEHALRLLQGFGGRDPVAPQSDLERRIAALWASILRTKSIGVTDDFFECGGHSLKAVQLLAAIEAACARRIPLAQFYNDPTIRGLSRLLTAAQFAAAANTT